MDGSRWQVRIARWVGGRVAVGVSGGSLMPAMPAPVQVGEHHHAPHLPLLALLAGALTLSLGDLWPLAMPLRLGDGSPPQSVFVEGVVEDFSLSSGVPHITLTTLNGQRRTLQLDLNATSVFKPGVALHPAHLRIGQRIRVSAISGPDAIMARSIEIVKTPQEMEPGPAESPEGVMSKFLRSVVSPIGLR